MKIAHFADVHIRNFKYREEYKAAFEDLYRQLWELAPDLVINAGDTVHSKLAVSPELFDDVANHMLAVTDIAPYFIILGNHDLNLKNTTRTDAISPIVRALQGRTRHQLRLLEPGLADVVADWNCAFWNYDIRGHKPFGPPSDDMINIGLYHGSISGCVTDQGFVMEEGEAELSAFDGMDFVMLGDIHKRQSFRGGRIQYPGSLIQQNYGEELVKGFLLWDIRSKDDFTVDFHEVKAPNRFFTVQVPNSLDINEIDVPAGSRLKIFVDGGISPSQRIALERRIYDKFLPSEVITPDSSGEMLSKVVPDIDLLIGSRDKLMREHLQNLSELDAEGVIKLFHQYESMIDPDASARGTSWKLSEFAWDNMLNYAEDNSIDLRKMKGLVGIFAPNASGKSSIFDVLLQGLFDCVSKDVPRNIDLVNDNKDVGTISVKFESGGSEFSINRTIERIHYGQRKLVETKQWGKTTLDFTSDGRSLNGTSRSETERSIRSIIGSFEDFALTAMISQNPIFGLPGGADLINCKETDRRKILFRILDLDVYEKINALVKNDLKAAMGKLKGDREKLLNSANSAESKLLDLERRLAAKRAEISSIEEDLTQCRSEMDQLLDVARATDEFERLKTTLSTAKESLDTRQGSVERARKRVSSSQHVIDSLEQTKPVLPQSHLKDVIVALNEARKLAADMTKSLTQLQAERKTGTKSLKILAEVPCGDSFPDCQFIVGAYRFKQNSGVLDAKINEITDTLTQHEALQRSLELDQQAHSQVESWNVRLNQARVEHSTAEELAAAVSSEYDRALQVYTEAEETLKRFQNGLDLSMSQNLNLLRSRRSGLEQSISKNRSDVEAMLLQIGATRDQFQIAKKEVEQYDLMCDSVRQLEHLAGMCGKNGLPYMILSLVLPLINSEIDKILTGITKFRVFFEDDLDEQTVSLYIRYGDYKSRPLSLGSGAEKFIASLAVRAALLSVTSLPKTDILIVDEGFGKLDQDNLESLQKMFEYLKSSFETVFIVSHVDFMKDIVDHSIEISSQNGYAHVEAS